MADWSSRADVLDKLRRRWRTGELLTAFATGSALLPVEVALRAPGTRDLAVDFPAVQDWVRCWRHDDGRKLRVEYKTVGGRSIGDNDIPCRVWIDEWPQLWSLLGVQEQVRQFADLLRTTRTEAPRLVDWMLEKPHEVLTAAPDWSRIVDTVAWIDARATTDTYLRQVDVPGVDTKFIEQHQNLLSRLLDRTLAADRIDTDCPRADFIGRYRFRHKPRYVRLRALDPIARFDGFTELAVRVDELAAAPPAAELVVVIENEVTYLALPPIPNAVAIFGGGYSLTRLDGLPWLRDRRIRYWGDIDTHGFVILDRLRQAFPHAESALMDRATLLAHETQWVQEKTPVLSHLDRLRPAEADLYRDLIEDTFGRAVRLEQERIQYHHIASALDLRDIDRRPRPKR